MGSKKIGKMEIGEEVDSKKKLDQRKKELQKQLRDIHRFTDIPKDTGGIPRKVAARTARY